jgi:hypothetical protein
MGRYCRWVQVSTRYTSYSRFRSLQSGNIRLGVLVQDSSSALSETLLRVGLYAQPASPRTSYYLVIKRHKIALLRRSHQTLPRNLDAGRILSHRVANAENAALLPCSHYSQSFLYPNFSKILCDFYSQYVTPRVTQE